MSNSSNVIALAAVGAAVFLLAKNSDAQSMTDAQTQDTSNAPSAADSNENMIPIQGTMLNNISQYSIVQKLFAFLYMIRSCEHVFPTDVTNNAAYNLAYGQQWFDDMSDHPAATGDIDLVPLPDNVCIAAGLSPGCHSSAAGAYQIILSTWQGLQRLDASLVDFSAESQDQAATDLLNQCGAVGELVANNFDDALKKASKIWASLPGSAAKQNPRKYQFCVDRFNEGLAVSA